MALKSENVKGGGSKLNEQKPIEPNTYPARLVQVIDLGIQPRTKWQSDEVMWTNDLWFTFELVTEFCKGENGEDLEDKPRWVSERKPWYGLGSENATTSKWYKILDPTNKYKGDWGKLLGAPCLVTVVNNPGKGKHQGKIFDNVSGINPPMKGFTIPDLINDPVMFDLDEPDVDVFNNLPDFLKDIIKSNKDFEGSPLENMLGSEPPTQKEEEGPHYGTEDMDDVPF